MQNLVKLGRFGLKLTQNKQDFWCLHHVVLVILWLPGMEEDAEDCKDHLLNMQEEYVSVDSYLEEHTCYKTNTDVDLVSC